MATDANTFLQSARNAIRTDPLLENLFKPHGHGHQNTLKLRGTQEQIQRKGRHRIGATTGTDDPALAYSEINWIKIPTVADDLNDVATEISMLSVKTYIQSECNNIENHMTDKRIYLSALGDITLYSVGGGGNYSASSFYENSLIVTPPGSHNTTSPRTLNSHGGNNTDRIGDGDPYTNRFIQPGTNFIFSRNLKWILYKIPNKRWNNSLMEIGRPSPTLPPVFVLLYNTIHRRNFQTAYTNMMQYEYYSRTESCLTLANPSPACGTAVAFSNTSIPGPPSSGYQYDSINKTIRKYCNAFTADAILYTGSVSPNTGQPLKRYGDPSCVLSINANVAKMNTSLRNNITQESFVNKYYINPRGVNRAGWNAAVIATGNDQNLKTDDPYCSTVSEAFDDPQDVARYLRNQNIISNSSGAPKDSFMQQLVNHMIKIYNRNLDYMLTGNECNPGTTDGDRGCAYPYISRTGVDNRGGITSATGRGLSLYGTGCRVVDTRSITNCIIRQTAGGDAEFLGNLNENQCGNGDHITSGDVIFNGQTEPIFIYFIIIVVIIIGMGVGLYFLLKKK